MRKSISLAIGLMSALAAVTIVMAQLSTRGEAAGNEAHPVLVCGTEHLPAADQDGCFATCGGEIPWPFQTSNQVVELADGERYVLMGEVVFSRGVPTFMVDLQTHPWLATARRRQDPSYRLSGSGSYWKQYVGQRVQLRVVARWMVSSDAEVTILLESLTDPAVVLTNSVRSDAARSSDAIR